MLILGIESSCDETAVAILKDGIVLSDVVSSQFFHSEYGGVVPELASRAHLKVIVSIFNEAIARSGVRIENLDAIAVTGGPGLIGSILVGLNFGKALAFGLNIPIIIVNHIEAHLLSVFLEETKPVFPYICLIVSGGHTQLVLVNKLFEYKVIGKTKDDSAGEAFDKVAKMLGIGYPGGPIIDKLSKMGNTDFFHFPRPCIDSNDFDFSFSGLKTSVLYYLRKLKVKDPNHNFHDDLFISNVCASFQQAVVDVLIAKLINSAKRCNVKNIAVVGGVSANSSLRENIEKSATKNNLNLFIPGIKYTTDNAAMIGMAGYMRYQSKLFSSLEEIANPNLKLN
jgi:N6-L-threonylcarbamoyladenine synthase